MNTLTILLLAACVIATSGYRLKCNDCAAATCPSLPRKGCAHGLVSDICDCCSVCGKGPGEKCDEFIKCGSGLTCKVEDYGRGLGFCVPA
ncbi:insulin-like growth factor-binding protein 7 [Penaeus japonicus]|uniref:insulin-like growth factor-binding protein 7 n=1 Tax=Penaeus japonicus TaxID=27405 RepID=UPI001C70E2B6|nr:insulin-like growth factor-binding protein 7 [Penaeus japonicus]